MTDQNNAALWDALGKTDPSATKRFKRAGGFEGTAIKPMWAWRRLTEHFGPFGIGWGCGKPSYELVPAGNELLVFCTVEGWHGAADQKVWGVGGDKVIAVTKNGPRSDDEAFKKAFTDALMNAFKFVGVGADVHMGLFDDNKYVAQLEQEFTPAGPIIGEADWTLLSTLAQQSGADLKGFCTYYKIGSLKELPVAKFAHAKNALERKLAAKGGSNGAAH